MIYICETCGFLFRRSLPQAQCPFCERTRVRQATEEEEQQLMQMLHPPAKKPQQ